MSDDDDRDLDAEVAELIFDQTVRALDGQERSLSAARARATAILSAASITTSFFAAVTLDNRTDLSWATWLAIASFVFVAIASAAVLFPRTKSWTFHPDAEILISDFYEAGWSIEDTRIRLAKFMEGWQTRNDTHLEPIWQMIATAIAFLGLEVLFWLLDLALYA